MLRYKTKTRPGLVALYDIINDTQVKIMRQIVTFKQFITLM